MISSAILWSSGLSAQEAPAAGGAVDLPTVRVTTEKPAAAKPGKRKPARTAGREPSTAPRTPAASAGSSGPGPAGLAGPPGGVGDGSGTLPGLGALSTAASAQPAATTTVGAPTIARMPVQSYGDIFRTLPGFNVSNYGQGAVGYGIALRGFTEGEHGRDIAFLIDGMPVNEASSVHTPNYVDLNTLIPETVKTVEIVRGPFWIEAGDSNVGGSVNIVTKRSEPFASATASGGNFATARSLLTYSRTDTAIEPYLVGEGYRTEGYRDNSWVDRYDSFNKFTVPLADGVLTVRGQFYSTDYGAPGYISRDKVLSGAISPRSAFNPADGGERQQQNFVANYASGPVDQEFSALAYVLHNSGERYADYGSGQNGQVEDRTMVGGRLRKVATGDAFGWLPTQVLVGATSRTDFIDTARGASVARHLTAYNIDAATTETNLASYAQLEVKPVPFLKLTGGTRYDHFFYDVTNRLDPTKSPNTDMGIWSPKAGVAFIPWSWVSVFGNYGQGFRSPDAVLELIDNPNLGLFKIESKEVGVKFTFDRVSFLASAWTTESQNEVFVPDAFFDIQTLGRVRREGFDVDVRAYVVKDAANQVSLFANYSPVRATMIDAAPSYYVPNVPDYVANIGINGDVATWNGERFQTYAALTFVGRKYMDQDGSISVPGYTKVSGKAAYSWPSGWTAFAQGMWYPSNRTSEIAINFGDVTGATSGDIYTSPQPGFTVLAGLIYRLPTNGSATPWMLSGPSPSH